MKSPPTSKTLRSKICVSIAPPTVEACVHAVSGQEFAEVRLDAVGDVTPADATRVFSSAKRLVATCRPGRFDDARRTKLLLAAVEAGARYVDVEVDAPPHVRHPVREAARSAGCHLIVSHHDYDRTPDRKTLDAIVGACFTAGADVAKVACHAHVPRDAARLLGLLDDPRRLIVIGMGRDGAITRIATPMLGAELTFACPDGSEPTAPGQFEVSDLARRMSAWAQ